jgi:hypothetical protein
VARSGGRRRSLRASGVPRTATAVTVAQIVAPFPAPDPTIVGKDEAMQGMTLHAQADLWQHGAATFAALFMAGEMRSPDNEVDRTDVLRYAVMNRGLRVATDLPRGNPHHKPPSEGNWPPERSPTRASS